MAGFNYPNDVIKDTPAVAGEVQGNFDALLTFLLDNMIQKDGTMAMTQPLALFGTPLVANHAAPKAYVDAVMPVGTILEYAGSNLPSADWLWCNGDIYSDTDKVQLSAAIGRAFTEASVPAGSFQVPDKRGRSGVGYSSGDSLFGTLGASGGSRDSELLQHLHTVPTHGHGAGSGDGGAHGHGHTIGVSGAGGHEHSGRARGFVYWANDYGSGQSTTTPPGPNQPWGLSWQTTTDGGGGHSHGISGGIDGVGGHTHGISVSNAPAFNTEHTGAGTTLTNKNLSPYLVCNYIIYAGQD